VRSELRVRGCKFLSSFFGLLRTNNFPSPHSAQRRVDLSPRRGEEGLPPHFRSLPRRRGTSQISLWTPTFAGVIGVLLLGCNDIQEEGVVLPIVCNVIHSADYNDLQLTIRLSKEELPNTISRVAEVSYGVSPKTARYFSDDARHGITLASNDVFPECIITIDRASGVGRHLCLGKSMPYPDDPRANTYDLQCTYKNRAL